MTMTEMIRKALTNDVMTVHTENVLSLSRLHLNTKSPVSCPIAMKIPMA